MKTTVSVLAVLLFCAAVAAQELPKIAVYVTGNIGADEKKALGTRMLASLVNSGRYTGIERSSTFLAEIEREQERQRSGAIDDSQISELGRQFGVKFVCIADITPAFGDYQVSARIVNVETAVVAHIGESSGQLASMDDLSRVSDKVVENMFGGKMTSAPIAPAPIPVQTLPAPIAPAHTVQTPPAPVAASETVRFEDIFFPSKKGTTLTYEAFNDKQKRVALRSINIKSVTGTANNGTIIFTEKLLNKTAEKVANVVDGVLAFQNGVFVFRGTANITEGNELLMPSKLTPGDMLPDHKMSYVHTYGNNTNEVSETNTDRKYTGIEKITVPAGTFECYRVEYKYSSIQPPATVTLDVVTYYARGIGEVKTIYYDQNGKLLSSVVLQKIKLPSR